MKKTSKRILSVVLSLIMVLTAIPMGGFLAFADTTVTLFHYDFESSHYVSGTNAGYFDADGVNLDSINPNMSQSIGASDVYGTSSVRNTGGYFENDDGIIFGYLNSNIRNSKYNKSWEITSTFNIQDKKSDIYYKTVLGLTDSSQNFIGINFKGELIYSENTSSGSFINGAGRANVTTLADSSTTTISEFTAKQNYIIKYVYNNGSLKIYLGNELKYTYDASSYRSLLEGIVGVVMGGGYSSSNYHGSKFRVLDLMGKHIEVGSVKTNEESWQILASTDFTKASFTGSSKDWTATAPSTTAAGGNTMDWKVKFKDNESGVAVDSSKGVKFDYSTDQGFLYLAGYNNQTAKNILAGYDSFKIDLAFSLFGTTKINGSNVTSRNDQAALIKLGVSDSSYTYTSRYGYRYTFMTQEPWGRRHFAGKANDDSTNCDYGTNGVNSSSRTEGGTYAITTADGVNPNIAVNTTYHYVIYYIDGLLGSYLIDEAGNEIINYAPVETTSLTKFFKSPSNIANIYLGNSYGDNTLNNICYKSMEIYTKENNVSETDNTNTKYLLTYFNGNTTSGETMRYAVSDDGYNFEKVNNGLPVWDGNQTWSIDTYPTTDSAPNTNGVDRTKHIRDNYAFYGHYGECYVLATDLDCNNSDWSNCTNSRFFVWKMDSFADIDKTTPWSVDTSRISGMDAITSNTAINKAWAPQAIWDPDVGKYMLYWSVGYGNSAKRMYYIYTEDFKTFEGTPKRLVFPESLPSDSFTNHIDGDITYYKGLYYMWFKNEDTAKLRCAVSPNANGPYSNITIFDDSTYALEGPQVYQLADGSWAMLTDAYNNGVSYIYTASDPTAFSSGTTHTTNASTLLGYRHGSVIRITDEEYNRIKAMNHIGSVKYEWNNGDSVTNPGWGTHKDSGTYWYDIMSVGEGSGSGSYSASGGTLSVIGTNAFISEQEARDIYQGDEYTITFTHRLMDESKRSSTYTAFAIGNESRDFVRLAEDGTFYVNGEALETKTTIPNASQAMATYTISYNGYATSLFKDGTYVCGSANFTPITKGSQLYIGLGWSDSTGNDGSGKHYYSSGEYGALTITPIATEITGEDKLEYAGFDPDDLEVTPTFNAHPYHINDPITSTAYNNVVYSPQNTTSWSGDGVGDVATGVGRTDFKCAMPLNTVLVYDGATGHDPIAPIMLESRCNDTNGSSHIIHYMRVDSSTCFSLVQAWQGYTGGNSSAIADAWTKWAGGNTLTATDDFAYRDNNNENESSDSQRDGNSRFWWNKLVFDTSYFTSHPTEYSVVDTNISFYGHTSYKNNDRQHKYGTVTSKSNNYVINYKPVYDIIAGDTEVAAYDGDANTYTAADIYEDLITNGNAWKYTPESLSEALEALQEIVDCNPNNFSYGDTSGGATVASHVSDCADAIGAAATDFAAINLEKRTFTITYVKDDGTKTTETVTAGNTITSLPANTPIAHVPSTNTHIVYSWPNNPVNGTTVPKKNITYGEDEEIVACNHTAAQTPVAADGDTNGYTDYACSGCGNIDVANRAWDDRTADWTSYHSYADVVDTNATSGVYTTSSSAAYKEASDAVTNSVTTVGDETKSHDYITGKVTALENAARKLNKKADFTAVDTAIAEKQSLKDTNNYDGSGNQINTFDSWMAFYTKYRDAYYHYALEDRDNTPKYAVDGSGYVTASLSDDQNDINTDGAALSNAKLTAITDQESFGTYDTSREVSRGTLDKGNNVGGVYQYDGKYTKAAIDHVEEAITAADGNVYHKLTAEDYEAYNTSTGKSLAVGTEIKNTTDADTYTGNVLSAVGDINNAAKKATYINQFSVKFKVQDEKGTTIGDVTNNSYYYGEQIDLTVPAAALSGRTLSIWSTSIYGGTSGHESVNPRASQKTYTNSTATLTKIVNANMFVTAEVSNDTFDSNFTRLNIYNAYKNLVKVEYSEGILGAGEGNLFTSELNTTFGTTLTDPVIPLYKFDYWIVTKVSNNEYNIVPKYTASKSFTISVNNVEVATKEYDQRVEISYSGSDDFVAWAENSSGKLKIASYSEDYSFFVCANENYVPLVLDGTTVKVGSTSGDAVTASMISGDFSSTGSQSADDFVQSMLKNGAPFVSIQTESHTRNKVRVYCRVTQGATGTEGFGVLFRKDLAAATDEQMVSGYNGTNTRAVTSVLDSGQYTYTLNNSKGFSAGNVIPFRAFANYKFNYTVGSNTYNNFNGTAYSDVVNITIS